MNFMQAGFKFIAAGGIWVIPILIVGALGVGVVIERYFVLIRASVRNPRCGASLSPYCIKATLTKRAN